MMIRFAAPVLLLIGVCFADTLTLKNGKIVNGTFLGGDARSIRIEVDSRIDTYSVSEIDRVQFGGTAAARVPSGTEPQTAQEGRVFRPERRYENTPAEPQSSQAGLKVPVDALLVVRMIDDVDSERDRPGQTFRASLDEPLMVDGKMIAPRGADVTAKLVDAKESGKFEGRATLTLALESMVINGRRVDVSTEGVTEASASRGARTAKTVGGVAAVGAVIGAIAGGGRGAAIGAASGAAAGGAASAVTKGQRVRIPAETRLSFTLQQPIQL